jgi:hypothetical protein
LVDITRISNCFCFHFNFLSGILHSVHWGLGHGCGEFIGGFFISAFGASKTFALFGFISLLNLLAYFLVDTFSSKDSGYVEVSQSDFETEHNNQQMKNK